MAKVKLALQQLTVPQKVQFLRQVVTAMTGNANFATPSPTLVTITAKADDLETTFNDAQAARLTKTLTAETSHRRPHEVSACGHLSRGT